MGGANLENGKSGWGLTPKVARKIYVGVALSKILYKIKVWCIPLY